MRMSITTRMIIAGCTLLQMNLLSCSFADQSQIDNNKAVIFSNNSIQCDSNCIGINDPSSVKINIETDSINGTILLKSIPDSILINSYNFGADYDRSYQIEYSYNFYLNTDTFPSYKVSNIQHSDTLGKRYVFTDSLNFDVDLQICTPDRGCGWSPSDYNSNFKISNGKISFMISPKFKLISFDVLKQARVIFEINTWLQTQHIKREIELKQNGT